MFNRESLVVAIWFDFPMDTVHDLDFHQLSFAFCPLSAFFFCRDYGWRNVDSLPTCQDPCVVCLERQCTVAAEGKSVTETIFKLIFIINAIS